MNAFSSLIVPLVFTILMSQAKAESFDAWLSHYKLRAQATGIPAVLVDYALQGVALDQRVIALDRKQPETHLTLQQYIDRTVTPARMQKAKELSSTSRSLLNRVEASFGVPRGILMALWGKETDFGGYTGNLKTIDALATLAYEGRRREFFEDELSSAIILLNQLQWTPGQMRGSWAGAVGQCQFMPSNYVKYGVDGNDDGQVDLWRDMSDVFFSMANLLKTNGWQSGENWGQSITLPAGFDKTLVGRDKSPHDIRFWEQRGVRFAKPVSGPSANAIRLYQPDGPGTLAYAIYPNFDVLMRWNHSGYFATAVGLLADSISSNL